MSCSYAAWQSGLARAVWRPAFFCLQYETVASDAFPSQRVSVRNNWSSDIAKYLEPEAGGCPSGF